MFKYEEFSKEELREICNSSLSYREIARRIGYSENGGSSIRTIEKMIEKYNFDTPCLKGQGWSKNKTYYRVPTEKYLNNEIKITSHKLRLRLIREGLLEPVCNYCNNDTWLGEPIPLELHHKNGDKCDNNLNNLELLCPNCHCFTDTYKAKNRKN